MGRMFYMPQVIISGEDSLKNAGDNLIKGKKALIISGNIVIKQECTKQLLCLLENAGVDFEIFTDIKGEPDDLMVKAGLKKYVDSGCDYMIAVGGGSPMDLMKAVAVLLKYPDNKLRDFMGKVIEGPFVPMIAIPTTAGTGSEATMFTVITDTETDVKMLLKGPGLIPQTAIVDPEFSKSAPKSITANTGLDALTHAVESFTSRQAQPLTDTLALDAVKKIMKYLPIAYADGNNIEARTNMAIAALEAGICITNASVTIVHGMSRPIGALFHVAHGLSNAMLLPTCMEFALDGNYEKFAVLGRETGAAGESDDDKSAAEKFLESLKWICSVCEVPTLEEYGIDKQDFFSKIGKMSQDAVTSGSPGNTVKAVTVEDCEILYKKLWD